ncbi:MULTISPECIES: hypothetical protein [Pseudomonas]|uniref:hypothetical protein n=1 Tax=Pseudomonas TaxID=286 RepID=UPI00159701F5|nr:hypothetical protein [Pseudomonas faucium]
MKWFSYRYLPVNIYIGYSVFVLASFFLGPIEYKGMDSVLLMTFLLPMLVLFAVGFLMGARGDYNLLVDTQAGRLNALFRVNRLVKLLLLFAAVASVVQWYGFISSGGGLSLDGIGESYVAGYEGYERGQATVDAAYILNIFLQVFITLALLFGFYYYSVMGRLGKTTFLFIVMTYLLVNVLGVGKQKYLGDLVIFSFFLFAINAAARRLRVKLWSAVVGGVFGCVVFFLFVEILRQRYQAAGISIDNIYEKVHPLVYWNYESWVIGVVGEDYALALGIFLGYFTNGLNGLYLSLTLPFEWSYLVGNSYSLGRIVEIFTGASGAVLEHTYPYRVGEVYGWEFDKWHSLFAWMASDFTFPGVVLLTPVFAYVYARVWLQAVAASNPFSGPLFIYLSMGLVFSYSNNQLMHSLSGVMVLVVLLLGWLLSRNRAVALRTPLRQGEATGQ